MPPPNAVETPPAPTENSDLKADASGYYGYGSYRPPYYPYYGGGYPYYGAYWPYAGYYSRPSYPSYYPYGYRNNYYSGMTLQQPWFYLQSSKVEYSSSLTNSELMIHFHISNDAETLRH